MSHTTQWYPLTWHTPHHTNWPNPTTPHPAAHNHSFRYYLEVDQPAWIGSPSDLFFLSYYRSWPSRRESSRQVSKPSNRRTDRKIEQNRQEYICNIYQNILFHTILISSFESSDSLLYRYHLVKNDPESCTLNSYYDRSLSLFLPSSYFFLFSFFLILSFFSHFFFF